MSKILLLEDDLSLINGLSFAFKKQGFELNIARTLKEADALWADGRYDLLVLDVSLPDGTGFEFCKRVRQVSKVPIIFLSSVADNMNIVMAVSMGADDFIAKPFDLEVLTVKIQALLRRSYDFAGSSSVIEHKGVMFQVNDGTITYNGVKLELTKNESKIMQTLLVNKEEIVTRDTLMTKLWESDSYVDENTLSVNVNRLRKKLAEIGLENFIITKKGIGYRIG